MKREQHGWLVVISDKKRHSNFGPLLYRAEQEAIKDVVWAIDKNLLSLSNQDTITIGEI